jgi:spermidine/putrescine transport system permease protein
VTTWRQRLIPYILGLPSTFWLTVFFAVPMISVLSVSLMTGNPEQGYSLTWHFGTFWDGLKTYNTQFIRSFEYGAISTVAALVIGYPIAYFIAFRGGRHKSTLLFIILLPFLVSYVIRMLAWNFLLADQGAILGTLKNIGILPQSARVLSTPLAVITGLTYDAIPYMVLPVYVALEKIDRRVIRAAGDLYASPSKAFMRIVLPLSSAGIFAGFLLVFVTNVGDYVAATILGGPGTTMIGNVIETSYLEDLNYPTAAALSSILMIVLLVVIFLYARTFGTEAVEEAVA